ncbi:hypothetical protein [Lysobacter gummosus]
MFGALAGALAMSTSCTKKPNPLSPLHRSPRIRKHRFRAAHRSRRLT